MGHNPTLGQRIRDRRSRLGLTQTQLESLVDFSQGVVSKLENDRYDPPLYMKVALELALRSELFDPPAAPIGLLEYLADAMCEDITEKELRELIRFATGRNAWSNAGNKRQWAALHEAIRGLIATSGE